MIVEPLSAAFIHRPCAPCHVPCARPCLPHRCPCWQGPDLGMQPPVLCCVLCCVLVASLLRPCCGLVVAVLCPTLGLAGLAALATARLSTWMVTRGNVRRSLCRSGTWDGGLFDAIGNGCGADDVEYVQWVSAMDAWRTAALATNGGPDVAAAAAAAAAVTDAADATAGPPVGPPLPRVFEGIRTVSELNTLMGIKSCWHRVAVKAAPRAPKS